MNKQRIVLHGIQEETMFRIRKFSLVVTLLLALELWHAAVKLPWKQPLRARPPEVDFEDFEEFDPSNFDNSINIDNAWLPLQAGSQWIFEGSTEEDGELIPHRIEFTVTDLTKEIEGVQTVVAMIEDFADGELVEAEIAFYAQDNDGNVWYLGEYPEEYEDGEFVDAPAWIAGQEGALAGVKMWAQPRLGTPSYAQGWAPEVEWSDRGQVYRMSQQICVPAYCGGDVLVIDEFSQGEPNAFQEKYYAQGIGNVAVGWRGEDAGHEELDLIDFVQLEPEVMAEIREAALALEEHAYEISDVYGTTAAAVSPPVEEDPLADAAAVDEVLQGFDANNFDNPTDINNNWLPMPPGRQLTLEGSTEEDDGTITPHRIVWTVTNLTKEINGVETVVAWIVDYADDELEETEIAFYAQDNEGNVWYFGEYPEEWSEGEFVQGRPWIAGLEGALAGIKMYADPQPDTPSYAQGWGPEVGWSDRAQVYEVNQESCVEFDCFEDVLLIDEFSADEPGAFQVKSYAPGVGNIQVGWRGDDPNKETLELVDYVELDAEALAEIDAGALALEERAFDISEVYAQTTPAQ